MAEVVKANESGDRSRSLSENSDTDAQFTPLITLPEVQVPTHEENEEVILKLRAKLYRFDCKDDPPEWKERGTGELKFLRHDGNKTVRLVMRRDKTLKVCANHFIIPSMELKPSVGLSSHKSFIYKVFADFSDGKITSQCLAIRFATPEIAGEFKAAFDEAREFVRSECKLYNNEEKSPASDDDDEEEENDESAGSDEGKENRNDQNEGKDADKNIPEIKKTTDDMSDEITKKVCDLKVD